MPEFLCEKCCSTHLTLCLKDLWSVVFVATLGTCFFVFSSRIIRCMSGRKWKEITADCFTEIVTAAYASSSVYHNVDRRSFVSHRGCIMQMQF